MKNRRQLLVGLVAGAFCSSLPAHASTSEIIILRLDARHNVVDAIKKYHDSIEAFEGSKQTRSLTVYARILVDGSKGFDCGALRLPRRLRRVKLYIRLIVTKGAIRKDIDVNLIDLRSSPRLFSINQNTVIY